MREASFIDKGQSITSGSELQDDYCTPSSTTLIEDLYKGAHYEKL